MQDIADRLNISKNAVSLALNNKPGVSEEMKKAIMNEAKRLNYAGMGESRKNDNNILVLIPEYIWNDNFFYSKIYRSIEKEANKNGCNAIMCTVTRELEEKLELPEVYEALNFKGIIQVGVLKEEYVRMVKEKVQLFVLVDHYYEGLPLEAIVTNNVEGAYNITSYLIESGHRELGFIAPIGMTFSFQERWKGFLKALEAYHLPLNKEYCIIKESPLNQLMSAEDELRSTIREMKALPTAWVCGNDRIAFALLNILHEMDIKTPEAVSVAGFDDLDAASVIIPNLTTVRVDSELMGQLAVRALLLLCENYHTPVRHEISTELVFRKSVRDIKTH